MANPGLHRLYMETGGKCHYCGRQTKMVGDMVDEWIERPGWWRQTPARIRRVVLEELILDPRFKKEYHDLKATVEHLTPRAAGGTNDRWNLALACARCNEKRGREWDMARKAEVHEIITRTRKAAAKAQYVGWRWSQGDGCWVRDFPH